jgi:hypothetical protein
MDARPDVEQGLEMTQTSRSPRVQWNGMIVASEPPTSRRMEAAKTANDLLLGLAEREHGRVRDEHLVGFFCECGCMDTATLTAAEYEAAGGAWCAGHKPIKLAAPESPR